MKRMPLFFILFLTAFCCTLTVFAADGAIHSVTIDGNNVKVNLTADFYCALWGVVYDENGTMIAATSKDIETAPGTQAVTFSFDNIPANAYAKAFLMSRTGFYPFCAPGDTRPLDDDVYAILYDDGTMVFQRGNTPKSERTVMETYLVDMTGSYRYTSVHYEQSPIPFRFWSTPWFNTRDSIKQVEFVDKIQPQSTAFWFRGCSNLEAVKGLENLDTANVTDMSDMFNGCGALTTLDVSNFNTANVTNMGVMFSGCEALKMLDVSNFNTANVTYMDGMFSHCKALTTLDVSNFKTANVIEMASMFSGCEALTTLDVSNFDTTNVMYMDNMFSGCEALKTLDVSRFNTVNVVNMSWMFSGCKMLETLDLSHFNTANVTQMPEMFSECVALTELDVSNFNTANVTDMREMFRMCETLTSLDLSNFDTANVNDMESMFGACVNLVTIYASDKFVTSGLILHDIVSHGAAIFNSCPSLVGGNGTTYDYERIDYKYARIDGGPENPGYFTAKT